MHHVSALQTNPELAAQHRAWMDSQKRIAQAVFRRTIAEKLRLTVAEAKKLPIIVSEPKGRKIYERPAGPMKFIFTAPIEEIREVTAWTVDLLGPDVPEDAVIPWKVLAKYVCLKHRLSWVDLCSDRRHQDLVQARHELWFLAKRHTGMSLPQIGRNTGARDHTTVLSGIRKYQWLLDAGRVVLWGDICRPLKQAKEEAST